MAFGSNDFPLGPNGQYPRQRIRSNSNQIAPPDQVEQVYAGRTDVKLPVTEKDFHSSIARVKSSMKVGKPHNNADVSPADIDKYRPRYAHRMSLRVFNQPVNVNPDNSWLKRSDQRFPFGLQSRGANQNISPILVDTNVLNPATGMSGVGFFGRGGNLGDVEQKYLEDEAQGQMNGVNYFRRPYR